MNNKHGWTVSNSTCLGHINQDTQMNACLLTGIRFNDIIYISRTLYIKENRRVFPAYSYVVYILLKYFRQDMIGLHIHLLRYRCTT